MFRWLSGLLSHFGHQMTTFITWTSSSISLGVSKNGLKNGSEHKLASEALEGNDKPFESHGKWWPAMDLHSLSVFVHIIPISDYRDFSAILIVLDGSNNTHLQFSIVAICNRSIMQSIKPRGIYYGVYRFIADNIFRKRLNNYFCYKWKIFIIHITESSWN